MFARNRFISILRQEMQDVGQWPDIAAFNPCNLVPAADHLNPPVVRSRSVRVESHHSSERFQLLNLLVSILWKTDVDFMDRFKKVSSADSSYPTVCFEAVQDIWF